MTNQIFVASRRLSDASLEKRFPGAVIFDVTSKGPEPWVRFSPFYPHGGIPIPFSDGQTGASVEGIWQGLKVFESEDIDPSKFKVTTMKGLKRTSRRFGRVRGHRNGVSGSELLPYLDARLSLYLPCYKWVLDHKVQAELTLLQEALTRSPVVLLDYETNADPFDLKSPLSNASLIKMHLEQAWPV
jgi:hypothetical protein